MPDFSDGPFCRVWFFITRDGRQTYTYVDRGRAAVMDARSRVTVLGGQYAQPTWRLLPL